MSLARYRWAKIFGRSFRHRLSTSLRDRQLKFSTGCLKPCRLPPSLVPSPHGSTPTPIMPPSHRLGSMMITLRFCFAAITPLAITPLAARRSAIDADVRAVAVSGSERGRQGCDGVRDEAPTGESRGRHGDENPLHFPPLMNSSRERRPSLSLSNLAKRSLPSSLFDCRPRYSSSVSLGLPG